MAPAAGRTARRGLSRALALLAAALAGALLLDVLLTEDRRGTELRDWRTGEIWACAAGGCQLND